MKVIIMVDNGAGNESVGAKWTDTYVFDEKDTLKEVLHHIGKSHLTSIQNTVRIQIAQEALKDGE